MTTRSVASDQVTASGILKKASLENSIVFVLVALFVVFSISIQYFFTLQNIWNILLECAITAIIAIGMTFVIIAGEIDLSVGSILCFSGMVFASLSAGGVNVVAGSFLTLAAGMMVGLINGAVVVWLKIPSFIATLAMMTIARGAALLWRNGETVRGMTLPYLWFGQDRLLGIPVPVLLLVIVFISGVLTLHYTRLGLNVYAIGGNQEAARLAGINVNAVKILIFGLIGILSSLSGVITASRLGLGSPITGTGKELDAIAAVVLGGASLSGGSGSVVGTLSGALAVTVLGNGMTLLRVSSYWQRIVIGVVIVLALALRKESGLFSRFRRS